MSTGSRAAPPPPAVLRADILRLAEACGEGRSICPGDVARLHGENWQRLLTPVRNAARFLAQDGRIDILRKGRPVPPDAMKGVVRLRIRPSAAADEPAEGGEQ